MYGMTDKKIEKAKYKIKCNKAFLKSHGIVLDNKIIPFSDFVANSYINPDRYIAELQHRAHSINDYAKRKGLSNMFLSLTLPSVWHPMKQKSKNDKTLIFNKKFGGRAYITKITHPVTGEVLKLLNTKEMIKKYQPRNASLELSSMYKKIQDTRQYKAILSDDRCYFRVTEPHKDGTPHLHISLFVPEESLNTLVSAIEKKYTSHACKIVLNVNSPVHYLMKYILKTLDDLRKDVDKVTALSLWYVYHGISRFYTSRTFVSLDIYRSLKGLYTLDELTQSYDNNEISVYLDTKTSKIVRIDNAYSTIYSQKVIQDSFKDSKWRQDMENEDNTYFEYEFDPIKFVHKKPMIDYLEKDDKRYIINNGLLIEIKKKPYQMKNYELQHYFENIDMQTVNPDHYAVTTNLMIDRGLLNGSHLELNLQNESREVF